MRTFFLTILETSKSVILALALNKNRARNCKKFAEPLHTWPLKSLDKEKIIKSWKESKENLKIGVESIKHR